MASLQALLLVAVAACEVSARQHIRAGGARLPPKPQADLEQQPRLARSPSVGEAGSPSEGKAAANLSKVQKFSQILAANPAVTAQLDHEATLWAREIEKASDGVVIVTTCNAHYVNLTLNLFESMKRVGRRHLLVFCDDAVCYDELKPKAPHGMRVLHLLGRNNPGEGDFNTPLFNQITSGKLAYISWFLDRNFTVLFTDSDVAWVKDPLPEVMAQPSPSLVIQDDTLEEWAPYGAPMSKRHQQCTGFFLLRPTPLGKLIADTWERVFAEYSRPDYTPQDQIVGSGVFRTSCERWCVDEINDCKELSDCRLLSRKQFPNGKMIRGLGKPSGDHNPWADMIVAHVNWLQGTQAKIETLMSIGFWYLPSS